jgi:hypothetical protein
MDEKERKEKGRKRAGRRDAHLKENGITSCRLSPNSKVFQKTWELPKKTAHDAWSRLQKVKPTSSLTNHSLPRKCSDACLIS